MKWIVQVVDYETEGVSHSIACESLRKAEAVERGLEINLNHERFFTRIVCEEGGEA